MDRTDFFKDTIQYYRDRAIIYDESAGYNDPGSEILRKPLIELVRKRLYNRNVIEIACGTGFWTELIASSAQSVYAIDIDEGMLNIAKERCRTHTNVSFDKADIFDFKQIQMTFNAAFHHFWFSHIPKSEIDNFLNIQHGLLSSDSVVIMADNLFHETYNDFVEDGNRFELRNLPNGREYKVLKNLYSVDELHNILHKYSRNVQIELTEDSKMWIAIYNINP